MSGVAGWMSKLRELDWGEVRAIPTFDIREETGLCGLVVYEM